MMVKVRFLPEDRVVEVEQGVSVLEAARLASVVIASPCNGSGTCGKCRVALEPLSPGKESDSSGNGKEQDYFLACETGSSPTWP